jgi:HlyD family secretion protein
MNASLALPAPIWKRFLLPLAGLAIAVAVAAQVHDRSAAASNRRAEAAASTAAANSPAPRVSAEGRVVTYPGAEVVVGTDLAGTVVRLVVDELDRVKKGQTIAEIRADDLRAEVGEARGRIAEAEADLRLAQSENTRQESLFAAGVGTRQAADTSRRDVEAAEARLATQRAAVARLSAVIAKTRIVAPIDGVVIARAADVGESLKAGDPIATVANLDHLRIEVEVDEFDAGRVQLGAPVQITAEGHDGRTWRGRVEEVPDAVVTRRLQPQDPGRPSDTRVLRVKISLDEKTPLKLGQRVETEIGVGR